MTHIFVILALVVGCIIFGLLRADIGLREECESCEGKNDSCGDHFCFRQPVTDIREVLSQDRDTVP